MSIVSRAEPGTSLRDTLKTSLCANRLFPTARLSRKEVPGSALTLNA